MNKLLSGIMLSAFAVATAFAQTPTEPYPSRPVKLVVPFSAASSADNVARIFAEKLSVRLKQPFIIDNRVGAGGTIGVASVAKAPADGYTLVLTTSSPLVINPLIDKNVTYNVERDLAPVAMLGSGGLLLVSQPGLPAKDLKELIELLKKNPGKYSFASNGNGSYSHMAMELFKQMVGVDLVHVPYKGPAQAETDVIGGQVTLMFDSVTTGTEMVKAGRLRAYGVSSARADAIAPQYLPIGQQGILALKDFDVVGWTGIMAPRDTPPAALATLTAAVRELVTDPVFRAEMLKRNTALVPAETVGDMSKQIRSDRLKWDALVKSANIRLE